MRATILQGDVRETLKSLPDNSVHCVVTSPPYWALRSYLPKDHPLKPLEIGSEPTPEAFIETMVAVFREVRRVMHPYATLWLNIGDGYAHSGACGGGSPVDKRDGRDGRKGYASDAFNGREHDRERQEVMSRGIPPGLKPKDLCLIPERLAIALQSDGWWVRSRIAWCKRSPMPESVTDRPTSAWEHIWLLTKSARYYYDSFAVRTVDTEAVKEYYVPNEGVELFSFGDEKVESKPAEPRQEQACGQALPGKRKREGETGRIPEVGSDDRGAGSVGKVSGWDSLPEGVSGERQTESCAETLLRERQGAGSDRSLPCNTQGQGVPASLYPQEKEPTEGSAVGPNSVPMGRDTEAAELPLPGVRAGEAANSGPHKTTGSRRASHGKQHSGALPKLQQPQERQAVGGASLRNFWLLEDHTSLVQWLAANHPAALAEYARQSTRLRDFWLLGPSPNPEKHFAKFVPEIPRRAILAGSSARGCCPKCLSPWERVVEKAFNPQANVSAERCIKGAAGQKPMDQSNGWDGFPRGTTGWQATCECDAGDPIPCTVLDPFGGSGTTAAVSIELGRNAILCELNPNYIPMIDRRTLVTPGLPLA